MMNEIYFHGEILIAPVENHAGTSLLYVRTVEGGVGVFMVDLARLARTQIALGNAANWGRSRAVRLFGWSPDDHYLAFSTIRENDKDRHVTICDGATGKEITSFDAPDPLETGTWLNGHSLILFDDSHRLSLYNLEDSDKLGQYGAKGLVQFRQLDSTASSPVADSEKSVAYLEDGNLWDLLLHDNLTVQLTHLKNYAICAGVDYCAATDKYLFAVTNDSSIQPILCQYDPRGGKSSVTAIKGCANYQFDARWIQNGAGVAYVGIDGNRYCLGVKAEGLASHTNLFAASPYNPNHGFLNQTVFPEGDQVIRTISVNPGEDKIYTVASVNYEPLGIWECDLASQKIRNVVPVTEHLAYSHSITPIESSFTNQDGENVAYYYLPPAGLKPDRRYPALIDTYSDLGYQPDSQFLANAGVFYVTVNPYGKGFPKEPTTPEDIVGVYREILKNPNVDPYRIYIGGQSAGTATIATLLADHSVLWRGAIILSPDAFQEVSPDTEIVASIFFSYGEQDDEENRERMERYAQTACARDALVQILYVRAGHGVFDIDELKNQYRAIATFILENR